VDPRTRRELARYGAPAAFLAAVTIAVVLVKAGLGGDASSDRAPSTAGAIPTVASKTTRPSSTIVLTTPSATATATTTTTTATTTGAGRFYVVQEGDTLGSIAAAYDTTVAELLRLNPDVDPAALRIGQRLRVS
jgi:LysM repeat protein